MVSVFPLPGTPTASAKTTISFRGVTAKRLGPVTVAGSRSGDHLGRLVAHSDGRGVSFDPDAPFTEGEDVTVDTTLPIRGAHDGTFAFTIARSAAGYGLNQVSTPTPSARAGEVSTYGSRPDLKPPIVTVGKQSGSTAPGDVFLTPNPSLGQKSAAQSGPMIVDGNGDLVWFDPLSTDVAVNLSVQRYLGRPVLAWYQGKISTAGYGHGVIEVEDESYHKVAEIHAGNGYAADLHDFVITPQNTALVLAYNPVVPPPSLLDGGKSRVVLDAVVQEIDIRTASVIFEWHSTGNIGLNESYLPVPATTTEPYDYVHPNAIALDTDGNLLVSARHTSSVYKIDRVTGSLDWRLGGKRSSFAFEPGAKFTWQHDVARARRWSDKRVRQRVTGADRHVALGLARFGTSHRRAGPQGVGRAERRQPATSALVQPGQHAGVAER